MKKPVTGSGSKSDTPEKAGLSSDFQVFRIRNDVLDRLSPVLEGPRNPIISAKTGFDRQYTIDMASSKEYLEYVLELLREVDGLSYKRMMGEYILYKDGVLFGGVYDNRFLIKKTKSVEALGLRDQIPYPGAKPMFLVDSESPTEIKVIVDLLVGDLSQTHKR